jgi:predicted MFS family arabinose efflux permease
VARLLNLYRDAFRGLSREVWILSAFLFINRAGTMVLAFLVLYLTQHHGYSESQAGRVLVWFGAGGVVGVWVGGALVDRVGFKVVQVGCLTLGGLGFIAFSFVAPGWPMSLGALALGFVLEGFRPANGAAISAFSRPENRARAFGLNRLAINLGVSVGAALGGILAEVDFQLLFWVDGATCLLAALGMHLVIPAARPKPREPATADATDSPWRDPLFLGVFGLLIVGGMVFFQVLSTYPLHLGEVYGYSKRWIGWILAINALTIVLVEMPLVKSIEGRRPLPLIGFAMLLVGLGFGLLPLSSSVAWVVALVLVWTVGEMLMAPMSITWVANRAGEGSRGAYMAAFGISFSTCAALAPLVGTAVFEYLGPNVLWASCLVLGLVACVGFQVLAAREKASTLNP